MIGLTKDEMRSTLAAYEELRCEGDNLSFGDPGAGRIAVDLRVKEPHQLVYLARLVANLEREATHFSHAHLWVTTWGVWNSQEEAIGRRWNSSGVVMAKIARWRSLLVTLSGTTSSRSRFVACSSR